MSFKSETYKVLIASPSDLVEERQVATEAINDWNAQHATAESVVLLPVKWETHAFPQAGARPQQAINDQLVSKCDILIGMFWTKLGTDTGVAESGTVEEIDQFVAAGKPAMLYFSRRPIDPNKIDPEQQIKLKKFQEATYRNALVGSFGDLNQLRQILLRDLMQQVRSLKRESGIRSEEDAKAQARRKESLARSQEIFKSHRHIFRDPTLRISLGPKLEFKEIVTREELFSFVKSTASQNQLVDPEDRYDSEVQMNALFREATVQYYQGGIYCFEEAVELDRYSRRDGRTATGKFINFDQFGLISSQIALWERTYYTGFNPGGGPAGETKSYFFWYIVLYLRHILSWSAKFYGRFPPRTNLVLKVGLIELWQKPFKLTPRIELPKKSIASEVETEDLACSSDSFAEQMHSLIVEACYQLLWNFGGEQPPEKSEVKQYVDHFWDGRE